MRSPVLAPGQGEIYLPSPPPRDNFEGIQQGMLHNVPIRSLAAMMEIIWALVEWVESWTLDLSRRKMQLHARTAGSASRGAQDTWWY